MFVGVGASVTGDTPVLIRKNGRTRLLPIAEFVDAYYRDGEHNRAIPIEDVETLGFFERESKFKGSKKKTYFGGSRWIRVSEVFRHKAGKVFEIHYLGGQIRTTEDHSIFIRTRNGIRAVATRDLKPGDRLVCLPYLSRKLHHHRDKKIIPFEIRGHCWEQSFEPVELPVWSEPPEWAEKYAFAINQKAFRSQHAIAQAIGVSQATVGNWQRFFHKPQALSDQRGFSRIPQKVMLSPQLLTLFGLYTAEGRSNGGPEFCFGAHESALHQETLHLMRQIFGVQGRVETTDTNSVRLHFPPPLLGEFFESHCGNGAHHKHVPEFLWNCPREYFLAYLEGWLKGDGYAAADGKLSGTSVSKRLIRELLWLCSMHGIKAGMRKMVFPAGRQIRKNGKPLPETTAWNLILSKSWNPFRPGPQSPQSKSLIVRRVVEKPHAGYVYDLCGCDGEAFFGGDKPILLHNSRVRDLFEQAKKNSPAVIFVDELDAVGRYRFAGIGGGHDEREQTLNQLLVELDGFDTKEGVIFLGSTNRPDVIDPALLRPGRFDRHVNIPPPDIKGREQILKVHAKKIKLAPEADLSIIARRTPGFVGADLANLVNEGALLAARRNKPAVEMPELEEAIDRVMAGPQRKSRLISDKEKKIVAYHEAGHALVAKLSAHADPVHKVSIIPRGPALGYTLQLPTEDRLLNTQSQLTHRIQVLLGGRCAEEVVFLKEITTGAQDDLEKATHLAHKMVTEFGMSPLGPVSYKRPDGEVFLGRDLVRERGLSEMTASSIDREVKKLLETCYQQARAILLKYRAALDALAAKLVEQEVLEGKDVDSILKNYSPA
ncbi:MAG: ATP-dependent zinc metalloprotease FtsH [Elusimicrobia bacterium]|nr:ATP-dependent zinc metalloprotease FtsH [Elusimicrobiota bacterium]